MSSDKKYVESLLTSSAVLLFPLKESPWGLENCVSLIPSLAAYTFISLTNLKILLV